MKNLLRIISVSLFLLALSCGGKKEKMQDEGITVLNIEEALDNEMATVNLSRYASSVKYIPLETTEESLLGEVSSFSTDGKNFYLASLNGNSALEFSSDGKFVKAIGTKGRGPGEHMGVGKIFLTTESLLGIMTYNKSIIYNTEGKYVSELSGFGNTGVSRAENLCNYGENEFILIHTYTDSTIMKRKEELCIIDQNGKILLNYLLGELHSRPTEYQFYGKISMPRPMISKLYTYGSEYRLVNGRFDTIFTYIPDYGKKASYIMDYGKYHDSAIEASDFENRINPESNIIMETEKFLLFGMFLPAEEWPMFTKVETMGGSHVIFLYDKADGKISLLKPNSITKLSSFINDLDDGLPFSPQYLQNGIMYQIIDAMTFIEAARESCSPQMQSIAAQLTDESNPVIMAVQLQ